MIKSTELRVKEVINLVDGRRLGWIDDLELDLESGRVTAVVVPGPARLFGLLGREPETVIPWQRIRKIGADVILVDLS